MHLSLIFIQCLLFIMTISSLANYNFLITYDLEATESLNEIKLSRKKRDSCLIQEVLDLTAHLLTMLSKKGTPKQTLEAASSLASFSGSVFGFQSPSICDLDVKLDKILVKLREVAETVRSIGHLVQCTQIKQNYRELSTKITTLLNIYDAFYRVKNSIGKENVRNAIIS